MPKIIYAIPDFDQTGEMRAPYQILKGFVHSGWDTEILTIESEKNRNIDKAWNIVPLEKIVASTRKAAYLKLASKLLNTSEQTIVMSWVWYWHCFSLMVSSILRRRPYILCLDGYAHRHPWHGDGWSKQAQLELRYGSVIRNASQVIAESPIAYTQVKNYYPDLSVSQIPICLWQSELESMVEKWNTKGTALERKPIILFVGRVTANKGIHNLLNAFAPIAKHYPEWLIEICGPIEDYEYFSNLQSQISHLDLNSRVRFIPPLYGEALYQTYRLSSIFCLPSTGEGMPTTILEAMYFGGAIVAGASGSVPFQLDDGRAGLLFHYGDVPQLMNHLKTLMDDEEYRESLINVSRQRVLDEFTWERYFPSIESSFRALINNGT